MFKITSIPFPRHVAIIMDGNGRWAQRRGLPRVVGHRHGAERVRQITAAASRVGLECLTLYSFSLENWKRPAAEVNALMGLYAEYIAAERDEMMRSNIRLLHVGRRAGLPPRVLEELDRSVELSAANPGLTLLLALNYGSRAEIADAVRAIAEDVAAGRLAPQDVDETAISVRLCTAGVPDPDLLIRTSGEMRLSNFLLWQLSYAEFFVTDAYWPDFGVELLHEALRAYSQRDRRFGALTDETA